jgi:hypothetical protein
MACKYCKCNRKPVIVVYIPSNLGMHGTTETKEALKKTKIDEDYYVLVVQNPNIEDAKVEALYFNGTEKDLASLEEKLLNQINEK